MSEDSPTAVIYFPPDQCPDLLRLTLAQFSDACMDLINRTSVSLPFVEREERCECLASSGMRVQEECVLQKGDYYPLGVDIEFCIEEVTTPQPSFLPTTGFPSVGPIQLPDNSTHVDYVLKQVEAGESKSLMMIVLALGVILACMTGIVYLIFSKTVEDCDESSESHSKAGSTSMPDGENNVSKMDTLDEDHSVNFQLHERIDDPDDDDLPPVDKPSLKHHSSNSDSRSKSSKKHHRKTSKKKKKHSRGSSGRRDSSFRKKNEAHKFEKLGSLSGLNLSEVAGAFENAARMLKKTQMKTQMKSKLKSTKRRKKKKSGKNKGKDKERSHKKSKDKENEKVLKSPRKEHAYSSETSESLGLPKRTDTIQDLKAEIAALKQTVLAEGRSKRKPQSPVQSVQEKFFRRASTVTELKLAVARFNESQQFKESKNEEAKLGTAEVFRGIDSKKDDFVAVVDVEKPSSLTHKLRARNMNFGLKLYE